MFSACLLCCNSSHRNKPITDSGADSIRINIFQVNEGYGYEIYLHDKKVVYQPTIPVVDGNANFQNKEFATETALLVSSKIRMGILPPSLTLEEMEALQKMYNK